MQQNTLAFWEQKNIDEQRFSEMMAQGSYSMLPYIVVLRYSF